MSKIAFFCIPAHGHTIPSLGVVGDRVLRSYPARRSSDLAK